MNLEGKISGKSLMMVINPSLVLKANSVLFISAYYAFCILRKSALSTVMKSKSAFSTVMKSKCAFSTVMKSRSAFSTVMTCYYVGTVNGPTSITRLGVWKMYQKVASFSILDIKNRH